MTHFAEIGGPTLDLEILRDFLANVSAAFALSAPRLLSGLFDWWFDFCIARGNSPSTIRQELQFVVDELKSIAPVQLAQELSRIQMKYRPPFLIPSKKAPALRGLAKVYLQLILDRDGTAARELIHQKMTEGLTVRYVYHRVLRPVLFEIGRLWMENRISIADEHYGTAVTQGILINLHSFIHIPNHPVGRMLLTGVQSELHDLGLQMVADFLEMDGWDTFYYGPNLPIEALCLAVERVKPDVIAISVTIPAHLIETKETIQHIRALDRTIPILVGGYPFSLDRSLCSIIGADAWAINCAHVNRVARRLLKNRTLDKKFIERSEALLQFKRPQYIRRKLSSTEELLRLTSELSTLHRQLAKRNAIVEELNEEKNRFLGIAAHDLRNAIQIINNSVSLLNQENDRFDESQRKLLRLIESSASSMADLVGNYLDISKIEAGKLELHRERIDLASLVEERLEMARLFADRAGVRLRRSGSSVFSDVDSARVSQALDNLILNAIKFSPRNTEVEIQVQQEGGKSVISVIDQGPGIPPHVIKHLFMPFKQWVQADQSAKPGTGLGLYIAKKVIEANGGKIWVTSNPSQGTTFSLSFPSSKVAPAKAG